MALLNNMTIADNIIHLMQHIAQFERQYERVPESVKLLAVSKGQTVTKIQAAYEDGLTHFGENYCQEALKKMKQLSTHSIVWHFIGPIQSNKTKLIAENFSWVHSIDRLKIAQRLNKQRPEQLAPLNVCIQVNLSHEASKSGVHLEDVHDLAQSLLSLPKLKLRGLMAIPIQTDVFEDQVSLFKQLEQTLSQLNHTLNLKLDTLSMGMSHDYQAAIKSGSTLIRLGQALFGPRTKEPL